MSIEYAILGFLSWKSLSGYDLKKLFAGSEILYWSGNSNQIYRALVDLHKAGLVSREIEHQESAPSRKVYTITDEGLSELARRSRSSPELPELRHHFLIQLAWAGRLPAGELDSLLTRYAEELHVQVLMLQEQERRDDSDAGRTPCEAFLWGEITKRWTSFYETELEWVRQLRQKLADVRAMEEMA
jgi:DNA-binding PadR family transcriptional regulator